MWNPRSWRPPYWAWASQIKNPFIKWPVVLLLVIVYLVMAGTTWYAQELLSRQFEKWQADNPNATSAVREWILDWGVLAAWAVILILFFVTLAAIIWWLRRDINIPADPSLPESEQPQPPSIKGPVIGASLLERLILHSLWENGYSISKISKSDVRFAFRALQFQDNEIPLAFNIWNSTGTPTILDMSTVIGATHRFDGLPEMPFDVQLSLVEELRIELARLQGIEWSGVKAPLGQIEIKKRVMMNAAFSQDSFYVIHMTSLLKARALVWTLLDKYSRLAEERSKATQSNPETSAEEHAQSPEAHPDK